MKLKDSIVLEQWSEPMRGVFSLADLRSLYSCVSDAGLYKKIEQLIATGLLIKIKRGLYARPSAPLTEISSRIAPEAYISTTAILEKNMMIGSVPARRIQAVKRGVPRTYTFATGVIEHLSIAENLFFGFTTENGIRFATPEKAWIDTCYYACRGRDFSFNLDTDVTLDGLDNETLTQYLDAYSERFRNWFNLNWRPS
jgi:hypothetical protein